MNPTRLASAILILSVLLTACSPNTASTASPTSMAGEDTAELEELKSYVVKQAEALHTSIARLREASDQYYALAKSTKFDYHTLWENQSEEVLEILGQARSHFLAANPQYERMEGVVAGVPSLNQYDLILDAGTPGGENSPDSVPFDLALPNGDVLVKPGNLFEVTESTLWGTDPTYIIESIHPDFNQNEIEDLGETLPNANVLKGTADTFEKYTAELLSSARNWQPTKSEAFGALIANIPTFTDFMESWKNSRFVIGTAATGRGFVATSRLSDLSDNIISWQKIYSGLSPAVQKIAPEQDTQITNDLFSLQAYVSNLYIQESEQGRRFTLEEVDLLNSEGQDRAVAIAGQIAQVAALLQIPVEAE